LRVRIVPTVLHAPPRAIAHVHNLIADRNATPVTLDKEPTTDEARAIAEAITLELQTEVDAYLHALNAQYYAPLKLHGWEVQRLEP